MPDLPDIDPVVVPPLLEGLDAIVWACDAETLRFTSVNQAAERLLGYPAERWVDEPNFWLNHVHPDDRSHVAALYQRVLDEGTPRTLECRMIAADGRPVWLRHVVTLQEEGGKGNDELIGVTLDVTAEKKAQGNEIASARPGARAERGAAQARAQRVPTGHVGLRFQGRDRFLGRAVPRHLRPARERRTELRRRARQHPPRRPGNGRPRGKRRPGPQARHRAFEAEYRTLWADGTERWVAARGQAYFEGTGDERHAVRLVGIIMDISDQREAEETLRQTEERLRLASDAAQLGTWDYDLLCGRVYWDDRCRTIYGFDDDEELTLEKVSARIHPEDRERVNQGFHEATDPNAPDEPGYFQHYRILRPDGTVRWVNTRGRVYFRGEGESREASRFIGTIMDITDQRQAERDLEGAEERLRLATAAAQTGTWDLDPETGILKWDDRCKALFGLPREQEATYELFLEALHEEDRDRVDAVVNQVLSPESGGHYKTEYRAIGVTDGVERWLAAQGQAFFDAEGTPTRFVGTLIDISDRKRREQLVNLLAQSGAVLGGSLDYVTMLRRLANLLVPTLADWCALDVVGEGGALERVAVQHRDPRKGHRGPGNLGQVPPPPRRPERRDARHPHRPARALRQRNRRDSGGHRPKRRAFRDDQGTRLAQRHGRSAQGARPDPGHPHPRHR